MGAMDAPRFCRYHYRRRESRCAFHVVQGLFVGLSWGRWTIGVIRGTSAVSSRLFHSNLSTRF